MSEVEDLPSYPARAGGDGWTSAVRRRLSLRLSAAVRCWRWWLPLAAAGLYLASLAVNFPDILKALYWNSDLAFMPLLAEDLGSLTRAGPVNMGDNPYFNTLWFLLATKSLPFHRLLWAVGPYLLSLAAMALMVWGAWRASGRWAALMTLAIGIGAGGLVLITLVAPGARVITWFSNSALATCLIFLAGRQWDKGRPTLIVVCSAVAILAGTTAGSDPLFLMSGLGPFLGAALILALTDRDSEARGTLIAAGSIFVAALAIGIGSWRWMESLGFTSTFPRAGFVFASEPHFLLNLQTLATDILAMGSGYFMGLHLGIVSVATFAAGVVALMAAAVPVLLLRPLLRRDPELHGDRKLQLWVLYWALGAVAVAGALAVRESPGSAGLASIRYAIPIFYSVAALAPVWARRSAAKRAFVAVGATLFVLLSTYAQASIYSATSDAELVRKAPGLISFLDDENLARGYAAYWDAHALTWNSDMKVRVYPVFECRKPDSTIPCPFPLAVRESWYRPVPGRSFILVNPTAVGPLSSTPSPELGAPSLVRHFGKVSVFVYDHDVGGRFASPVLAEGS